MLPIKMHLDQILEQLKYRYESIIREGTELEQPTVEIKNEIAKPFFDTIAFFVYYILVTPELSSEFVPLLSLTRKRKEEYVAEILPRVHQCLETIGHHFYNIDEFESKCAVVNERCGKWVDPFRYNYFSQISTNEFFKLCIEHPGISEWDYKTYETLLSVIYGNEQRLNGIYPYWPEESDWDKEELKEALTYISEVSCELKGLETFQHRYTGTEAALKIYNLYYRINPSAPIHLNRDIPHSRMSFLASVSVAEYAKCCSVVYNYLRHKITTSLSKQAIIKRFAAYMELYRLDDFADLQDTEPEKVFQKEFEQFIFFHGLYPISEAQLNTGRLDTLSNNYDQSFLCELKQIGYGSDRAYPSKIREKLKKSITQSPAYHLRLTGYPNLASDVYIIAFSRRPLRINPDYITFNGVTYHFYVVNFSRVGPQQQKLITIDPNDLITNEEQE